MKRTLVLLLALASASSVFAAAHVTTLERVNLRAAPAIADNVIRTLDVGESLRVVGSRGDWLHVQTSSDEAGWVNAAYVAPPPAPIIDRRVKCSIQKEVGNLLGEDLYFVQAFAVAFGRGPAAVSERFSISSLNVVGSTRLDDEAYARFVQFVRNQSGEPCGPAGYRDPYDRVPRVDVIESPDIVARVGRCSIHQTMRVFNGFDEYAYQGSVKTPAGTDTAASYRYTVSAENVFMGDAPLAGDLWALLEFVKSELRANDRCEAR